MTVASKSPVPSPLESPHVMVEAPEYPASHVASQVPAQTTVAESQLCAPLAIVGAAQVIAE